MVTIRKSIIKLSLLLLALFFFPQTILAQDEFTIDQKIIYHLNQQDGCLVDYQVEMANNFSSIYATQYTLSITGNRTIRDINAYSGGNQLRTEIDRSNRNLTKITIFFDSPVTGKDKINQFTISYQVDNFIESIGQTKRVNIPKIDNIESYHNISLVIAAPQSFGSPAFISPKNFQENINNNEITITFNQVDLLGKDVMAIFGDTQSIQFNLLYFLENQTNQAVEKTIALPPDTSYQKIFLTNISPQPERVDVDQDGNWLARYLLTPESNLTIEAQGVAQITAEPQIPPLATADFSAYLQEDQYWETSRKEIKNLAQELKTAEKIYRYIVDHLEYNLERVKNKEASRQGALAALENPDQAICTEFTDLFIALARSAGIPAREINGYAYSANPQLLPQTLYADVLHSWPEYWDSGNQTWRQVDPTWESTSNIDYFHTMDMTHLAFAIHGQNSQLPLPAGAYQKQGQSQKSINIAFTSSSLDLTAKELVITWEEESSPGKSGTITITNPNNQALYNTIVSLTSDNLKISPETVTIEALPPLGQRQISITVSGQSIWGPNKADLTVLASNELVESQETILLENLSLFSLETIIELITNYWYFALTLIPIGLMIFLIKKLNHHDQK